MKKLSSIILALAALSFAAVSCQEEEIFQPGEPEEAGCYGVYFPVQDASGSHTYDPTAEKVITIKAVRTNSAGDITVPVKLTSNVDGVFQAEPLTFAAGQTEAEFNVRFDNIETGKESKFSVTIEGNQYISKYNDGAISLDSSILCVEWQYVLNPKTNEKAVVTFTQTYWGETAWAYIKYYEVNNIRYCYTETFLHEYNGEQYDDPGFFGTDMGEMFFKWYLSERNGEGNQFLEFPTMPVYYNETYSAIVYTMDWTYYWNDFKGYSDDWLTEAKKSGDPDGNYPVGYYDGNGGFYFYTPYYYMKGIGGWGSDYWDIIGVVDGYVRVDYSLDMELDYAKEGVMPANFEVGADVASIKIAGFEGELTATQIANKVAGITAGTEENIVSVSTEGFEADEDGKVFSGATGLSFEKSGIYTVVAVAFDKDGKAQNSASACQFYVLADDSADYAVELAAGAETVPSRYGEYDSSTSFAYYVVGKDIKDAHLAVIESAKYNKSADEYNAEIKADEDEDYALDSDSIEAINGAGGYYAIVDGLSALTEYTVVVWATNGNSDGFTTTTFTTEGLPNEVIKEGTAYGYGIVLNQLFFDTEDVAYDEGLNLEFNPNTKMYEIPHWGNDVTFKFTVSEDGEISVPIQAIGVSMADYGDFAVMDANLCDTFFGPGNADYFGFDVTKKSFIDEDGNYHFYLLYASTEGYAFGVGYEVLYVDGVPSVKASAPAICVTKSSGRVQPIWESSFVGGFINTVVERSDDSVEMTAVEIEPKAKSFSAKSTDNFKANSLELK